MIIWIEWRIMTMKINEPEPESRDNHEEEWAPYENPYDLTKENALLMVVSAGLVLLITILIRYLI